jgi:hypothetical protein
VSRASTFLQARLRYSNPREAAPRSWQWIFAVLILAGMILIGVSVLLLLHESAPAHAADACLWVPRA